MSSEEEPLDLYDISLLLNYERVTTEPRFRHAKLREVVYPGDDFETVLLKKVLWVDNARPRTAFVFDRPARHAEKIDMTSPPDLPSNILPDKLADSDKLKSLTPKQLETAFWQARGHDACYTSVTLLQHFFDLFPPSTLIRIRHGPQGKTAGKVYTTCISTRVIWEMMLVNPKQTTLALVFPENKTYISGEDHTMKHAVVGFSESPSGNIDSVLDLSSMQFGDVGRGPGAKGQGLFALDTMNEYYDRLEKITEGNDDSFTKMSQRIGPSNDDKWLKLVAKKAKERWEERDAERWCGHCGAPGVAAKACSACHNAWYCDEAHQKLAWPFHKHYCAKK
ncbi:hypothetical protein VKT23_009356 [Stygiomarasmius scandens]|uniref:MYND-type domain-containing protein n=1 Tax=Marasmiellus scandens TaxID=2682957 RepID=A0ABR1JHT4_9AGAR